MTQKELLQIAYKEFLESAKNLCDEIDNISDECSDCSEMYPKHWLSFDEEVVEIREWVYTSIERLNK